MAGRLRKPREPGATTAEGYGWTWQKLRKAVLAESDVCHLCGGGGADSADHIVPKAAGGTDDLSNLAPAHLSCNAAKRDGRRRGPYGAPASARTAVHPCGCSCHRSGRPECSCTCCPHSRNW